MDDIALHYNALRPHTASQPDKCEYDLYVYNITEHFEAAEIENICNPIIGPGKLLP